MGGWTGGRPVTLAASSTAYRDIMTTETKTTLTNGWPPRPPGEQFPPLLDTLLVGQLLLCDHRNQTPEQGRRTVRGLVKQGLPKLGRVGASLLFNRDAVLAWLGDRENYLDSGGDGGTVDAA